MDQTNTYIPPKANYVKNVFEDWNAMAVVAYDAPAYPSGRKKRAKRWAPAATLNISVIDWNNVLISYTYQYGERWVLYRDELPINLLPWGGFGPYSGSYTDTEASPGTTYTYSMRRDDGDVIVASRGTTTWAHNFPEQYDMPESGDVKTSLRNADHSNWYILDGRAVTSLPVAAQAAAIALGYLTELPNAAECCLRGSPTYLGEITGTSSITLNRNQLPDVELGGTTNSAGAHRHITYRGDGGSGQACPGWEWNDTIGKYAYDPGDDQWMSTAGAHTHTITTESLNGNVTQQAIDITPKSFNVNLFIWLL